MESKQTSLCPSMWTLVTYLPPVSQNLQPVVQMVQQCLCGSKPLLVTHQMALSVLWHGMAKAFMLCAVQPNCREYESHHPAESSENTAICAKIRKFGRGFEELLPAAILDQ